MTSPISKKTWRGVVLRDTTNVVQSKRTKVTGKKKGGSSSQNKKTEWRHRAHLITDIDLYVYSVREGDEDGAPEKVYNLEMLESMFPVYAAVARLFAAEEEREPEGFIACSVYALVEKEFSEKRHQVYRRIAYQANYSDCTRLPEWLKKGIRDTWSYPGKVFVDHKDPHERGQ